MQLQKQCLQCGKIFSKSVYCNRKQWLVTKYCCQQCAGLAWIGHPAPKSAFKKGQIPWNRGKKHSPETIAKLIIVNRANKKLGQEHHNWKGTNASYGALHTWVRRHKGKPIICKNCEATNKEKKLHWANIDHKYKRNLDDYIAFCVACHKKHDLENKLCRH